MGIHSLGGKLRWMFHLTILLIEGFRHRSATIINFICEIINLSVFVPGVVGRYDLRPGLFMTGILSVALSFTLAWQAIWMRGVPHQGGEMDDDED